MLAALPQGDGTAGRDVRLRYLPAGDSALIVEFGSDITPALNAMVVALDRALAISRPEGLIETVPTYRSLMVIYDPLLVDFTGIRQAVAAAVAQSKEPMRNGAALRERAGQKAEHSRAGDPRIDGQSMDGQSLDGQTLDGQSLSGPYDRTKGRRWTVPVCYGGERGDDLAYVAAHAGLTERRAASLHADADYPVYMIGFAPGFTYLGGLPEPLHIPRRDIPRPRAEAGSIMVGGMQAAIASVAIPTGWYVIGRTPVRAFDMARAGMTRDGIAREGMARDGMAGDGMAGGGSGVFLFRAGDTVRFEPVSEAEFDSLAARAAAGDVVARPA